MEEALRFNEGKLRYDLFEPFALKQLANVFTMGANKYGDNNWTKGMKWSKVIASLKRHISAFESGEDYDPESKLLHSAHISWNAMALTSYYKLAPQYDDRPHAYLNRPKIGLDIDEVICDWMGEFAKKHDLKEPKNWYFSYSTRQKLEMSDELKEWYLNLPPKMNPDDLPFEPHCYLTSRSIPIEITEAWIEKNGFPTVPVYCVPLGASKVAVAKESGIDMFIDDKFENFVELNKAGVCTFLLDAPHNQRYDVGYKRIHSIKELFERYK